MRSGHRELRGPKRAAHFLRWAWAWLGFGWKTMRERYFPRKRGR